MLKASLGYVRRYLIKMTKKTKTVVHTKNRRLPGATGVSQAQQKDIKRTGRGDRRLSTRGSQLSRCQAALNTPAGPSSLPLLPVDQPAQARRSSSGAEEVELIQGGHPTAETQTV